jgi:hypothetical protein
MRPGNIHRSGLWGLKTYGAALLKGLLASALPDDRLIGDVIFYRRVQGEGGGGWAR